MDKNCWTSWSARSVKAGWVQAARRRVDLARSTAWPTRIRDGIPVMLEQEARRLPADEEVTG